MDEIARPDEPPLRVMALHALEYCERLFYLEEVEELRVADAAVFAGRRLHEEVVPADADVTGLRSYELASEAWGLFGKIDAARRRDGGWIAYEHKRGRCRRGDDKSPQAWPSDRLQVVAYAVLLEEELGKPVPTGRVRYHADNVTVAVPIDEQARADLRAAVERARLLRRSDVRPPVHENERVCRRCSLKVVCLPEEERSAEPHAVGAAETRSPATFFPARREGRTLHITSQNAFVSRSGRTLVIAIDGDKRKVPIEQVDSVLLHGHVQMTAQAIHLCVYENVALQWLTAGGKPLAGVAPPGRVRQRRRQYEALGDPAFCLRLARTLVRAKIEFQLKYLMRGTREEAAARSAANPSLSRIRECLAKLDAADNLDSLRGLEGMAAKAYFAALQTLLSDRVPEEFRFSHRSKRPPKDRFNCLLSFGYGLVHGLCERSLIAVGLEPAFGFFHQPRSAAPPLTLDLMELFRTLLWEMPLIGSLNRNQWRLDEDFELRPGHVWLSDDGRRKAIGLFEARLTEAWRHPHTGQSLEYARTVELEARLLEKEWTGHPGHFAQLRIR